jgi:hypothetical protein
MPMDSMVVIGAITAAFVMFAVVLLWADFQTRGLGE